MAKVNLNPILKSIHGRINNVVFYCRHGKGYLRLYAKGSNPDTAGQRAVRRTFANAVKSWQALTPEKRFKYNRKAANLSMSGYNLYISEYMKTEISALSKPGSEKNTPDRSYLSSIQRPVSSVSPPFITIFMEKTAQKTFQYEPG